MNGTTVRDGLHGGLVHVRQGQELFLGRDVQINKALGLAHLTFGVRR